MTKLCLSIEPRTFALKSSAAVVGCGCGVRSRGGMSSSSERGGGGGGRQAGTSGRATRTCDAAHLRVCFPV
jgi:hypothetical protein